MLHRKKVTTCNTKKITQKRYDLDPNRCLWVLFFRWAGSFITCVQPRVRRRLDEL